VGCYSLLQLALDRAMLHTSLSGEEEHQLDQQEQPRWQPTRRQLLWTLGIVAVLTVAVLTGYRYDITLWDWIKLLVVPAVIAGVSIWFNYQQQERQREVENRRTQDAVLQAYLDQMGQLLLDKDKPLRQSKEGDEVSMLARARTLTALSQLDGKRKGTLIRFLSEARLIQGRPGMESGVRGWTQQRPIIGLTSADLSDADLSDADLTYALLAEASLRGANLRGADLSNAVLFNTDLTGAIMPDGQILKIDDNPDGPTFEEWRKSREEQNSGTS
jgi:hypothetical protein